MEHIFWIGGGSTPTPGPTRDFILSIIYLYSVGKRNETYFLDRGGQPPPRDPPPTQKICIISFRILN